VAFSFLTLTGHFGQGKCRRDLTEGDAAALIRLPMRVTLSAPPPNLGALPQMPGAES
jgi:hypothetical protein